MSFYDQVYDVVKKIPCGKVATYGQIARVLERPRASRAVGNALHINPYPSSLVPCHRVVNRQGRLTPVFAFGGCENQKKLLENEGVLTDAFGFIDLKKYQCKDFELA